MRLLLDECVPRKFKDALPGHDVRTARETVDQNVGFQQNVAASGIAVIVLRARSNRLKDLLPLAPAVLKKLSTVRPGALEHVTA